MILKFLMMLDENEGFNWRDDYVEKCRNGGSGDKIEFLISDTKTFLCISWGTEQIFGPRETNEKGGRACDE